MQSTVTFKSFHSDGSLAEMRTTRHQAGFRLDVYANGIYPYDKISMSYTDTNDQKVTVHNADGKVIAEFLLIKDAPQPT